MSFNVSKVPRLLRNPLGLGQTNRFRVNLLGVGGVGSNIVDALARCSGGRIMVRCYDHDTVELHNLNRTPLFRVEDVTGETRFTKAQIARQRHEEMVVESGGEITRDNASSLRQGIIIDARDTLDPNKLIPRSWIKLAYDGGSNISFTFHPEEVAKKIFELRSTNSYEVVPSFFVPAAILSLMTIRFMEFKTLQDITEERAGTTHFDIDRLVDEMSYAWEPAPEQQAEQQPQAETADNFEEAPL